MKLGFMIYSLGRALADKTLTVPAAFALIKQCGAEGVDITAGHVAGYTMEQVRKMLDDAGLCTSCNIGGASLTMNDPAERAKSIDAIRRVIDDAVTLGTETVLVTTGGCAPDQDKAEGLENVATGLAEVIAHAKQAGVTLSIEDFGSPVAPYQTSDECLECCRLAGGELMITYDSGNMVMGDEDPVEFLRAVEHKMVHAHAKDWEALPADADFGLTSRAGRKYTGCTVGTGVLDYPAIIGRLKEIGYEGFLSFEYEGRTGDPVQAAKDGCAYLLELMGR